MTSSALPDGLYAYVHDQFCCGFVVRAGLVTMAAPYLSAHPQLMRSQHVRVVEQHHPDPVLGAIGGELIEAPGRCPNGCDAKQRPGTQHCKCTPGGLRAFDCEGCGHYYVRGCPETPCRQYVNPIRRT